MENLELKTADKVKIAFNHYANGFDSVVIIIHGWFMTKDSRPFRAIAESFATSYDIISFDCRGHGKSGGKYTFTVKEQLDLEAIVSYATNKYQNIYLMGFSLGGALAILYASKNNCINKVIAVSAPADFNKIENKMWSPNAFIPTFKKCELNVWFSIRASLTNLLFSSKIKPIDVINKIECPILFLAGEKDPTVCEWHSRKLFNNCIGNNKEYFLFTNGLHAEDLFLQDREKFKNICIDFLDKA